MLFIFSLFCLFAVIFIWNYYNKTHLKYLQKIEKRKTAIINLKENSIEIISFDDLSERVKIDYDTFLKNFPFAEKGKIENWIRELFSEGNLYDSPNSVFVSDFYTNNEKKKKSKKKVLTRICLWATSVNKKDQIIYLNIRELRNLPSTYNKSKKSLQHNDVYTYKDVERLYNKGLFIKGSLISINFEKGKNTLVPYDDYFFRYVVLNELYKKDEVFKLLDLDNSYVFFDKEKPLQIYLITKKGKNETNYRLERTLKKLEEKLGKLFETMGAKNTNNLCIVASKNSFLTRNFDKNIEVLNNLTKLCREDGRTLSIYKNDNGDKENIEDSYKNEIIKLIKNSSLEVYFLPVYKITNKRVFINGYISRPVPVKSAFYKIGDARKYADKNNLSKEFSSLIAKKTIPAYSSQRENISAKLFYPIVISELGFIQRSLTRMSNVDTINFAFVIDALELVEKDGNKELMSQIKNLQEKDFEFYLKIRRGDFILKDSTFDAFDGYLVDAKLNNNVKIESREYLTSLSLIGKLTQFKKPIISINTNSWAEIEILSKAGLNLFASKVIVEESQMIGTINKKNAKKLLNMYKK